MNQDARNFREFCQREITRLYDTQNPLNEKQTQRTIVEQLKQMHLRLALLEGVDLRSLEDISS